MKQQPLANAKGELPTGRAACQGGIGEVDWSQRSTLRALGREVRYQNALLVTTTITFAWRWRRTRLFTRKSLLRLTSTPCGTRSARQPKIRWLGGLVFLFRQLEKESWIQETLLASFVLLLLLRCVACLFVIVLIASYTFKVYKNELFSRLHRIAVHLRLYVQGLSAVLRTSSNFVVNLPCSWLLLFLISSSFSCHPIYSSEGELANEDQNGNILPLPPQRGYTYTYICLPVSQSACTNHPTSFQFRLQVCI